MNLKEIHYGIEIETVKRTREQIAWAIHSVVGGTVRHVGIPSSYDPWEVEDLRGRVWKVVGDASLTSVPAHLRAEVVSPVLGYDDIPQLQEVVRAIRRAGGKINSQCGIHIHIDAAPFDGRHLGNLAKIIYKQEPLILHALGISRDPAQPLHPAGQRRADPAHRTASPRTKDQLNRIWYGYHNRQPSTTTTAATTGSTCTTSGTGARWSSAGSRRPSTRGGSRHTCNSASRSPPRRSTVGPPPAASGTSIPRAPSTTSSLPAPPRLIGDEFKTARKHLMANMPGDAAFKNGRPKPEEVLPDETTTHTNEAGQVPGLTV